MSLVTSSTEKVSLDTAKILESASKILQKIEKAKIKEQYDLIQKKIEDFSIYAKKLSAVVEKTENGLSSVTNSIKKLDAVIQQYPERYSEKAFTKIDGLRDDLIANIENQNKKINKLKKALFIPLGFIITIQVLTLILMLIR